jgi:phenylpyruvate tautomerase PptA (4-oxalocrotonate tautomerase family)
VSRTVVGGITHAAAERKWKAELAAGITETFVSVCGEPIRGLGVVIDDLSSGHLAIGGRPITTEAVKEVLAGAPASA